MTMPLWPGIATVAAVVLGTLVTRFPVSYTPLDVYKRQGEGPRVYVKRKPEARKFHVCHKTSS